MTLTRAAERANAHAQNLSAWCFSVRSVSKSIFFAVSNRSFDTVNLVSQVPVSGDNGFQLLG
jgi:hypothetical protein